MALPRELNSTALLSDANLQLYLRLENNLNDSSPNGYTFTDSSSQNVTGKFGQGRGFTAASSQYIYRTAASMANAMITTTQSWMFWIKFASFSANNYIMGRSTGGNWFMNGDAGGGINCSCGLSTAHNVTIPSTGVWHHVCFMYNSSTNKISSWINGVINQNQVSVTGTFAGAGTNFGIGRIGDYPGYGTFEIDDVAMFNREIVQADINKIFPSDGGAFLLTMI